jgi:hypothetical protein
MLSVASGRAALMAMAFMLFPSFDGALSDGDSLGQDEIYIQFSF